MIFDLVIEGATVVSPHRTYQANVGVVGETIAAIDYAPMEGHEAIKARGKYLIPGVIDTHVHLQPALKSGEVGEFLPWSDGYDSGSKSAAFGGVTTLLDMRVQKQKAGSTVMDAIQVGMEDASHKSVIDFAFHAGLTFPTAETIAEIPQLVAMGIPSFKFFMTYPNWHIRVNLGFIYEAFFAIKASNAIAAVHSEDDQIIEHLKRKFVSLRRSHDLGCYALTRPDFAEELAIGSVGVVARETGARAYAVHVSSRKGLEAGKRAKSQNGGRFFMECAPHHLMFTDDVFRLEARRTAQYMMGPPYRTDEDIAALWDGIRDGSIDWMGSDHSPFTTEQKTKDMRFHADPDDMPGGMEMAIPTGLAGIEVLLPIMLSEGVGKGRITIERLVELMCATPARALGFQHKGAIKVGNDADIVIVDPDETRVVQHQHMHSNTDFTLYEGVEVKGWPIVTISRGSVVVRDGKFVGREGHGRFVKREIASDFKPPPW
jgi:dihydropyrimidinase